MKWICLVASFACLLNAHASPIQEIDTYALDDSDLYAEEYSEDYVSEESSEKWNELDELAVQEEADLSLPVEMDQTLAQNEKLYPKKSSLHPLKDKARATTHSIQVSFREVFLGSPIIYGLLFSLSVVSICIWLYSMLTVRSIELLPPPLIRELRTKLLNNQFNEALDLCVREKHFFCKMLASGILVRKHGLSMMTETMKAEGKRSTIAFWQRINLLNDIAVIAPMIGLLGTVVGMFYAFYDLNRSLESISLLFDGLGISVGTTVGGLIVAIIAMILHSTAKYRLVRVITGLENEVHTFAALIDTRAPTYLESLE